VSETIEVIEPINPVVAYDGVRAELARLETESQKMAFDYQSAAGQKQARSHIHELRGVKGRIESERKRLKADAIEYGRRVDAAAKELEGRVVKLIDLHNEPLEQIARREEARKAAIQQAIDNIDQTGLDPAQQYPSTELTRWIGAVEQIVIDPDVFQERMAEAAKLKAEILAQMRTRLAETTKREAQEAELARLRAEAEARERADREAKIAAEAEARAKAEAERKAQIEREAAAKREADAIAREQEAIRKAQEAERRAAEAQARAKAEAEAEVARKEAVAQAERERREADKRHMQEIERDILKAFYACGLSDNDSEIAFEAIKAGNIPHVKLEI
jgi:hypothetical protein